jgi:hypothetical protein
MPIKFPDNLIGIFSLNLANSILLFSSFLKYFLQMLNIHSNLMKNTKNDKLWQYMYLLNTTFLLGLYINKSDLFFMDSAIE